MASRMTQIRENFPQISRQTKTVVNNGLSQNTAEVGGSSPSPLTIIWGQKVGLPECPYLKRWVLDFRLFSIRLHRWQSSDDARAFHDHPWWFVTLVLWGRYIDVSPQGADMLRIGSLRYRPANHQHTVQILYSGTWTILITGRPVRRWGFWVNKKLIKRDAYFAKMGHHPCSGGNAIRQRPDGSRI